MQQQPDDPSAPGADGDSSTLFMPVPTDPVANGVEPRLVALNGPRQGLVYPLTTSRVTIGRRPSNSIVIPSGGISKSHCTVGREERDFFVEDNDSTNGTLVNGRALPEGGRVQLAHGDTITVFNTTFLFLNSAGGDSSGDSVELRVDFQSAAREAEALLRQSGEALNLRRVRAARRTAD